MRTGPASPIKVVTRLLPDRTVTVARLGLLLLWVTVPWLLDEEFVDL